MFFIKQFADLKSPYKCDYFMLHVRELRVLSLSDWTMTLVYCFSYSSFDYQKSIAVDQHSEVVFSIDPAGSCSS